MGRDFWAPHPYHSPYEANIFRSIVYCLRASLAMGRLARAFIGINDAEGTGAAATVAILYSRGSSGSAFGVLAGSFHTATHIGHPCHAAFSTVITEGVPLRAL